jgi:hypothetical protein
VRQREIQSFGRDYQSNLRDVAKGISVTLVASRTRPRKPKNPAPAIVRRKTLIMDAIPQRDVIKSAKVGVEALLLEQSEGTVFVQSDCGPCWRITVEIDETGGVA